MKYGIIEQGYVRKDTDPSGRLRQLVAEAQAADTYGFDSFAVSEQHFKFPTNSTGALDVILPWVTATTNLRILPSAVILSLHHPLAVAERWATIDVLSEGRLDFAVGRGNTPKTADAFQVPHKETNARTMESLDIIFRAWSGEEFSYEGDFWQFKDVRVHPTPMQRPHPRVSLAAVSPGSAGLAGTHRLGYLGGMHWLRWSQVHDRINAYNEAWESGSAFEYAEPLRHISLQVPTHVARTSQLAREQVEFGVVEYANRAMKQDILNHKLTYGSAKGIDTTGEFYDNFQGLLDHTSMLVGSPDYCIEKLLRIHEEYDIDEVVFHLDYATHEELLECIRLLGEEVLPTVKKEISRTQKQAGVSIIAGAGKRS